MRFKISVVILFLLAVATFLFSVFTVRAVDDYILNEVLKRAETVGRSAAATAAYSIAADDLLGTDNVVSRVKDQHTDVDFIAVADNAMKAIAHSDISKRGESLGPLTGQLVSMDRYGAVLKGLAGEFEVLTPISFVHKQLGYVMLGLNKSILFNAQKRARNSILKGFAAAFFFGVAGVLLLTSIVTKPIAELSAGVMELKKGKNRPLKVYSRDELGKLTESFNEMSALIVEQKDKLGRYAGELEEAYISTLRVLAAAIDARDAYTLGHSARVASLSLKLGEAIGLSKEELEELEIACLLHDVGKIKTPDHVLLKAGRLDNSEFREMSRHTEDGAEILAKAPMLMKYIPAVKHHHEWYNGNGYPDGLSGDAIPLSAAIITIADSFDAMTSTRPYRNARSEAEALKELVRCSGTQFNPGLVQVFIQVFRNEHEGFILPEVI
ncbi:MAG: HD domain-containing protein [Nitrospiraceae bacterium]|nr:HD domain-containing protein [Nitrospiraceae bacterium]